MPTCDLHQHLWPATFVDALRQRRSPPHLSDGELVTPEGRFTFVPALHDVEARLQDLDRDEIDAAVVSLQPSLGVEALTEPERHELEEAWVDGIRDLAPPGSRLLALAPWRVLDGFAGTSVGASALVDLDRNAPLLDEVAAARGFVFVHPEAGSLAPATRPDWWEWTLGYTGQMQAAYLSWLASGRDRWPELRVVFAMLAGGAPFQLERLVHRGVDTRSALDPNVFLDVATYGRRAIELCIETFGVGQLVYGSDTPVVDARPTLRAVRGFGDAVARVLQTETPTALLT